MAKVGGTVHGFGLKQRGRWKVFIYFIFHEKQIKKLIDSPFGFCGAYVCIKLLHYGNFPIYCNNQILGLIEESKGYKCITNTKIARQNPTTMP